MEPQLGASPPAPAEPRFLVADDHAVVRAGVRLILTEAFPGCSFGEAADGEEAVSLAQQRPWDLALLDVSMPACSGLVVLKVLRRVRPKLPTMILSVHPEFIYAKAALRAGAKGYLTKAGLPEELVNAVRKVLEGGCYVSQALAEQMAEELRGGQPHSAGHLLSAREAEVLRLIVTGLSGKEIGAQLGVSEKTVSTYRLRLLEKLHLSTTADLIRYALSEGIGQ